MGSPSKYTPEIVDEICERLSDGEPLRQICRDKHMPSWRAVYDWLKLYPDFAAAIARARELGYDAIAEDALRIADTPITAEEVTEGGKYGLTVKRGDAVDHRKLQIWTRLQLLAKWSPEKYGERIKQEHSGSVSLNVTTGVPVDDGSDLA